MVVAQKSADNHYSGVGYFEAAYLMRMDSTMLVSGAAPTGKMDYNYC